MDSTQRLRIKAQMVVDHGLGLHESSRWKGAGNSPYFCPECQKVTAKRREAGILGAERRKAKLSNPDLNG